MTPTTITFHAGQKAYEAIKSQIASFLKPTGQNEGTIDAFGAVTGTYAYNPATTELTIVITKGPAEMIKSQIADAIQKVRQIS